MVSIRKLRARAHRVRDQRHLYTNRRMLEGVPDLSGPALDSYRAALASRPAEKPRIEMVVGWLNRLIDMQGPRKVLVVGCGPQPEVIRALGQLGYDVRGVEPVRDVLAAAREYLGDEQAVVEGSAEELPCEDDSQDVVMLESVLEHVDSVGKSLAEAHRVLAPSGVAYVITTNRYRLRGSEEFNVRLFHLLPDIVKESYVFHHLHYDPFLASYAERPAVHWFTFAELCKRGREAGFFQFYSHLDLKDPEPTAFAGGQLARRAKAEVLKFVQRSPVLRAAALSQTGGQIFMVKRP